MTLFIRQKKKKKKGMNPSAHNWQSPSKSASIDNHWCLSWWADQSELSYIRFEKKERKSKNFKLLALKYFFSAAAAVFQPLTQKQDNAHKHTFKQTHVLWGVRFFCSGLDLASRLDSPSIWRHVSFVVYEFISLLSWTLWTQSPTPSSFPSPVHSPPVLKPYIYPFPTKVCTYTTDLNF